MLHLYPAEPFEPPVIIDDVLLVQTTLDQGPTDDGARIAKEEGLPYEDVLSLRLDFLTILKIENLDQFVNLTKLQLNNNIIEKMENLGAMRSLRWLDLSYNHIEKIEGLENLTQLEDLSLYNNLITVIENLDNNTKLEVLSLGKNDIKVLDNLLYLRILPKLRALNLTHSPVCKNKDYTLFVAGFLPNLVFLDHRVISAATKHQAHEEHFVMVELMTDAQTKDQIIKENMEYQKEQYMMFCNAFVEDLDNDQLFLDMYANDSDGNAFNDLPGIQEMVDEFKEKFVPVCQQIFNFGLEIDHPGTQAYAAALAGRTPGESCSIDLGPKIPTDKLTASSTRQAYRGRVEEERRFYESLEEAKAKDKEEGERLIQEFLQYKQNTFAEIMVMKDVIQIQDAVFDYNHKVTKLWDQLMSNEMTLLDQIEDIAQNFSLSLDEHVVYFLENVQGYTAHLRELETAHTERLAITVTDKVENSMHLNWLNMSLELHALMTEKDTALGGVAASHDAHMLAIDIREDKTVNGIKKWMDDLNDKILQEEIVERSRHRISEISHFIKTQRKDIGAIEMNPTDCKLD